MHAIVAARCFFSTGPRLDGIVPSSIGQETRNLQRDPRQFADFQRFSTGCDESADGAGGIRQIRGLGAETRGLAHVEF